MKGKILGNIVNLSVYRNKKKNSWLKQHEGKLFQEMKNFNSPLMDEGFDQLYRDYVTAQSSCNNPSWDYIHFRDLIFEYWQEIFATLYQEISQRSWFDARLISKEEVLERCFNLFLMHSLRGYKSPSISGSSRVT